MNVNLRKGLFLYEKWRINRPDPVKTAEFMNKCDLKSLTLDVMTSRGFTDFDSLADF